MGTTKMLILSNLYGQRSNNFIQYIHLDSFCRENGVKFYCPQLRRFYKDYPNLKREGLGYSALRLFFIRQLKLIRELQFTDPAENKLYKDIILNENTCCEGWEFRSSETARKYRSTYREIFDPAIDKDFFTGKYLKRSNGEPAIAVHIRRGDYKEHLNGRYFYDDLVYINKIQQLVDCLKKECRIIVFTNDPELDTSIYKKHFSNILFSDNSPMVDHYLMSKCDYIIGAPSTFSIWASYIGDTPCYHIYDPNAPLEPAKFEIYEGL
jgi:hypothetical protein